MPTASGWMYSPDGFAEGTVTSDEGVVTEVTSRRRRDVDARGLILPGFVNAHTHLGDAIVIEEPTGTLEEVVAPPHGLKFRRLQEASLEALTEAMRRAMKGMVQAGTTASVDFREGGRDGIDALRQAVSQEPLEVMALGRPRELHYEKEEVARLLEAADGVAVSSITDWEYGPLEELAAHAKKEAKVFALHASEVFREDLDKILDLSPDFLVHMTAGREADWERCAQEDIPVAVSPRSQVFFGRVPDLPGMREAGLRLMLGTDNAMLSHPSILREMEFAYRVAKLHGGIPPEVILRMGYEAANLLTRPSRMAIREGEPCNFLVMDLPPGGDAAYRVIQASETDIALLAVGPRTWDRGRGWLPED